MQAKLEAAGKMLSLVSVALAAWAAWTALPLDAEMKRLQVQATRLDSDLKVAEARLKEAESRLKEAESDRKLSFDLYQEVKKVLEKKDKTARDEEALRVLIEALAEDPFRYKLLAVLAVGATTEGGKQAAAESSTFFREEAALTVRAAPTPASTTAAPAAPRSMTNYDVDVFYCADQRATTEPVARRVAGLKQSSETGRWRLRSLPESVNQQPGYGLRANEIRYNLPEESDQAAILQQRLQDAGIRATLRPSAQPTPWYLSVFICE